MRLINKQIMLIDDDDVLLKLLTRTLETRGCIVHSCNHIREALKLITDHVPDLIILDLNMPQFDGFTFLKFRQKNELISTIPVLVLSGTKSQEEAQKALELGAAHFISKPFESRIILQKVRSIFQSKERLSYQFPASAQPLATAEIQASIIEQGHSQIKIESQVKFCAGKSVVLMSDEYPGNSEGPSQFKIDDSPAELNQGLFKTLLTSLGIDTR